MIREWKILRHEDNIVRTILLPCLAAGLLAGCRPANPLVGTSWTLVSLNDQNVIPETAISAAFKEPNRGSGIALVGSAGCNCYQGSIEIHQGEIEFNALTDDGDLFFTTDVLCAQDPLHEDKDLMDQEERYLNTLFYDVKQYTQTTERLEMMDQNGKVLLVFQSGRPENERRGCTQ